jgi:hypothetical protein
MFSAHWQKRWRRYLIPLGLALGMMLVTVGLAQVAPQTVNPPAAPTAAIPTATTISPTTTAIAANVPATKLPLSVGIGLAGISDWSTQNPFLDAFKTSRAWIPQCEGGELGCLASGQWDTGESKLIDLDANGWVKSLPPASAPPKFTRVATLLFRDIAGRYPLGRYLVLYDGEGKIEYKFVKQDLAASKPGRHVIIPDGSNSGIGIVISQTDPQRNGNYIRNIRVIPAAYEANYRAGEIFHPNFVTRLIPFKTLRMMDWMATNNSEQQTWQGRPRVAQASYAYQGGVPVEIMVALANKLQASPWFTLPHKANDDYVRNFATYVRDHLDPKLKVYVEYSNEVWNGMFQQQRWAEIQGKARWGAKTEAAFMKWYGFRAAQVSQIWKQVFGAQANARVLSVFATQTAWHGLETAGLNIQVTPGQPASKFFDVYAIAPYVGSDLGSPQNQAKIKSWLGDPDGGYVRLFRQMRMGDLLRSNPKDLGRSLSQLILDMRYHKQVAQKMGYALTAYEGGQHLVGHLGVENDQALTDFFIGANRHPRMYEIYQELLQAWKQAGGSTFMHFVDIGNPGKWGSWGALEYPTQPQGSPKYNALIQFIDKNRN